jgi:hypothetical protein
MKQSDREPPQETTTTTQVPLPKAEKPRRRGMGRADEFELMEEGVSALVRIAEALEKITAGQTQS